MRSLVSILVIAVVWLAAGSALAAGGAEVVLPDRPERSLPEWYAMGGFAMHALSLCSVLMFGTIAERVWTLRSQATVPPRLAKDLERSLEVGNRGELKRLCSGGPSALARLAGLALDPASTAEIVEERGALEAHRLQRNLPLLSALGNLATMIGLFGTVLGMIEAFDMITVSGTGDARVVAGGIFRALITTAAGLGIGILAVAAHALLSRCAADRIAELEALSGSLFRGLRPLPKEVLVDYHSSGRTPEDRADRDERSCDAAIERSN